MFFSGLLAYEVSINQRFPGDNPCGKGAKGDSMDRMALVFGGAAAPFAAGDRLCALALALLPFLRGGAALRLSRP